MNTTKKQKLIRSLTEIHAIIYPGKPTPDLSKHSIHALESMVLTLQGQGYLI